MAYLSDLSEMAFIVLLTMVSTVLAGRTLFLGREPPRTLQMIGSANPRMLHKISSDLQPDTSKVVHIQVPYYIERPKPRTKKFQPWIPRGQRFVSSSGVGSLQQHLSSGPVSFGTPFPAREAPFKAKPILPNEFLANPGPYDTPFVPVMKPSPVNPLHVEQPAPEIMFEPISILPLEAPSFATIRNHVNYLKQKQHAFFEGQGREFGLGGATVPDELEYFSEHDKRFGEAAVHNGDSDRTGGERNTLSEHDFGQNDRKYDRRGKAMGSAKGTDEEEEEQSEEEDFYDSEGKQYQDDDFEDSRDETDRAAAFEPKKVYTQVRHREIVRHVPRSGREENVEEHEEGENEEEDEDRDRDNGQENDKAESHNQDGDDEEDDEDEEDDHQERHHRRLPIRERVNLERKNIVYSEKGRQAHKFDHGSEESFGEFEQKEEPKSKRRNRIKRSTEEMAEPALSNRTLSDQIVDVLAMVILGNETLPLPEALTDPRELHGEELIKFLDEAIQNTTQYLPEGRLKEREVISIVSPPSNVVKFPYYNRPASEIDVDSALRYAENLTSFSTGLYDAKTLAGVECNEVDVELEDEPEPIAEDTSGEGFKPIRRLKGLGDKIDCLKRKHFGSEPLDNPLFREEFVGVVPRKMYVGKGTTPAVPAQQKQQPQPNPAVAVYNDVIRHIKKHLASQQRRKNSKADTDQDTVMIAVPRILRLDHEDPELTGTHLKREARLAFPQANPLPVSNHISVPIFDISKFVPRFMMRPNEDLFAEQDLHVTTVRPPRVSSPKVRLQTLVRTAEQLAEGAVAVEEGVEQILTTERSPVRDDIADAFDDVLAKPNQLPAPLPPIKPYSVVEKDTKDSGPEATFNKSGPPYAALALEPPVAQSILKQRIAPLERNHLDLAKAKRFPTKKIPRKTRRPSVTRKKVLVFYH
ncbi:uncharacterized protein LOC128714983 [Anopheles marshallii]|uniref:uncharacterized protein LOC128714983 n=1 Tax=Anopheles marshallii TaxID=1521116 RepID=UPI00237BF05A|nr:uncharacterized protein LOC128714983 [Anopheles marshallii]